MSNIITGANTLEISGKTEITAADKTPADYCVRPCFVVKKEVLYD